MTRCPRYVEEESPEEVANLQQLFNPPILEFPEKFQPLFRPFRYKVFFGGRGGAKSWCFARALLILGAQSKLRILCAREFQNSIADSVHKLLSEQITQMGLSYFYTIQQTAIKGYNGTEFLFKGLRRSVQEIKSTEGIDICWVEEAQAVSNESWEILIPTIRKPGSEIWISFNPGEEEDPTWKRFIVNRPPLSAVEFVNYWDNPWFPEVLRKEMEYLRKVDYEAYQHVWEGVPKKISDAVIFKGKYSIEPFNEPADIDRYYYGVDWGFAVDPTVMIRAYIWDNRLFITHDSRGIGVDFDQIPALFDQVPDSRYWLIYADNARPETISYIKQKGFKISAADKWPGSVEDGIAFLRKFDKIIIHPRAKDGIGTEARLYKYKQDPNTQEILPVVVDQHNHGWDALRYALGKEILRGGSKGTRQLGGTRLVSRVF